MSRLLDSATRPGDMAAAAEALRADPRTDGIPILVLSPGGLRGRALDALRASGDEHVTKPLQGSEYLRKVRDLLARRPAGGLR